MNFPGTSTTTALVVSASQAATVTSPAFDLLQYDGPAMVVENHGAGTGTLDGKLQQSIDGSTGWTDTGLTFTQKTVAASTQAVYFETKAVQRYVRFVGTIVTGPHLLGVTISATKKYT